MSDYTQSTFFAPKDSLASGNPDKVILGAELDPELSAISTAIASKYDSTDIASAGEAQAESLNTKLITPARLASWSDANGGLVGDIHALADPNADRILFWDDSAGAVAFLTVGGTLSLSGTTLALSHLGLESLVDPNADRILFWDDSAGAAAWLSLGSGLSLSGTTLSASAAGIDHDALSGFVADEHIAHSGITLTAGAGLTGGGTIAASRSFAVGAGSGITVNADDVALDTSSTRNVDHTGVNITAGEGLSGGGTIDASRTIDLDVSSLASFPGTIDTTNDLLVLYDASAGTHYTVSVDEVNSSGTGFVAESRLLTAGNGLSGGGDLSADRTFTLDFSELTLLTGVVSTDYVIVYDTSAGEEKRITVANFETDINHDNLSGFVANEHVDHSAVSISAGTGLTGGGTIAASRTISLSHLGIQNLSDPNDDRIMFWDDSAGAMAWLNPDSSITISGTTISVNDAAVAHDSLSGFVSDEHVAHSGVSITAGTGLTGGGTIAASRTINLDISSLTNMDVSATASTDSVLVNDGGTMKQMDIQDMGIRVVTTTGSQTFALSDSNTMQLLTGATGRTFTIPSGVFHTGATILVGSRDTADLTIDPGTSVTLTSTIAQGSTANRTVNAGGMAALVHVGGNEWMISGDIS